MLIYAGGGLFDEGENIAHAEDAGGHPVGIERLQVLYLFADARKLDGLAGHSLYRKGGAAAAVAVQLGQDDTIHAQLSVKGGGHIHGVLSGHRVDD